jgi:3-dehydroquinate synthase
VIEVPVELGARRYRVTVGHGAVSHLPALLGPLRGRRTVVVSSPRIWSLHGPRVERALRGIGTLARVLVPEGEQHKSPAVLGTLYDAFLEAGLARDGLVLAFGGGVVGDLAGFAAATYMRGVDWVVLPSTLLAMVDSAIGGKVAVNHPRAKNLLGAFHQPRAVVVDPSFLATLPIRELRSGAYEILKCGVLGDRALVASLAQAPAGLAGWGRVPMEDAIAAACRIKAKVVERDEREAGLRRVLNLGHTLGHALEAATRYRRFTHGEAVGWGLIGAAAIARRRGLLTPQRFEAIATAVDHLGPRPPLSDLHAERILEALAHDKKAVRGRTTFVLPVALGRVVVTADVRPSEVRAALRTLAAREADAATDRP